VLDIPSGSVTRCATMPIEIDLGMMDHMRASSGAIEVELRDADLEPARRGLELARLEIGRIPHPEQPEWPCASFASAVEVGPRGPGFWFDMADAEVYDGLLEGVLLTLLAALEEAGLDRGVLTWPESTARTRMSADDVGALRAALDAAGTTAPAAAVEGDPGRPAVSREATCPPTGWSRRASLPTRRTLLSACSGPDGRIYAIGGNRRQPMKTVEAYEPAADRWMKVASLRVPRRSPGAATGPDGRVYAIGGYNAIQGGVTTVEALDLTTNRWEMVAPMASLAYNDMTASAGTDGRIYALALSAGGGTPNILEAYDAPADRWTPLSPPKASYGNFIQVVAAPDGRIYAFGAIGMLVEAYDPRLDSWVDVSQPRHPRSLFGAALGGDGWICHGRDQSVAGHSCRGLRS